MLFDIDTKSGCQITISRLLYNVIKKVWLQSISSLTILFFVLTNSLFAECLWVV